MARQSGLIKIKGTLDNVTFYKSKDGDLAKMKTSVDKDRIANDPAYQRTRENGAELVLLLLRENLLVMHCVQSH